MRHHDSWQKYNEKFEKRLYLTYNDYLEHQKSKLKHLDLVEYDIRYRNVLRERLEKLEFLRSGMTVICLAARIGTEVKAFLDIGCFAIGIDLNPGDNNQHVVYGDFHNIQFPSGSVDVVFTNSLDHVFDIKEVINEAKRITKPDGRIIIEVSPGAEEGKSASLYESFWWSKTEDIIVLFSNSHLKLISQRSFTYPWDGNQLCFIKENKLGDT